MLGIAIEESGRGIRREAVFAVQRKFKDDFSQLTVGHLAEGVDVPLPLVDVDRQWDGKVSP